MNMIKQALDEVFGNDLPEGTTSFHTYEGNACFLIGASGSWVDLPMTDKQKEALRLRNLLGTLGWSLQ